MSDGLDLEQKGQAAFKESAAPEFVYINMDPRFASLVFTVPTLDIQLPENTDLQPTNKGLTIKLRNNGKFVPNKWNPERFEVNDWTTLNNYLILTLPNP